ncbi:MAG: cell surface protein [Bacteroidetes bacterium]|nr:cell surface protein [Bacteroidota bacterium]
MGKKINLVFLVLLCTILLSYNSKAQCNPSFTYTLGGNNTSTFQASIAPTNTTTTYSWAFGDGSIANGVFVNHQFPNSGSYTVTLNVMTSSPSCSSTISQTINPTQCPLNANFVYTINPGGVVNFSNTSTGTSTNTSCYWFFGNGTSTGPANTTSYTYTNNGTYSASVYLFDSILGCTDSIAFPIIINGLPCNLNAGFTSSTINGSEYFSNTSTPNSPLPICNWSFGDGATGTQFSPVHTYSASGTYTVLLTVNQGTCSSSFSSAITTTVAAPTPTCSVTANFTYTLGNNGSVSFSNTSSSVNTTTMVTTWNFGNGYYINCNNTPTYSFPSNGTYSVILTVTDSTYSCSGNIMIPITISNVTCGLNPTNIYFYSSQAINGGVTFYSNMSNTNNLLLWTFGNGTTTTAPTPNTTYSASGIYTVTLAVSDPTNPSCSTSITQTISVNYYPCTYSASFTSTLTGNILNVTNTSTGSSPLPYYMFNWGDGNSSGSNTVGSASHTYSINGIYNVCLTAMDSTSSYMFSCYDTISTTINITTATPCPVNSNYSLQKDNSQLYSWFAYPQYGNNVTSVTWNWGDGTSSNALFPSHTYSAAGWYNVCLTVSLSCGSQSTTCYNSYLNKPSSDNAVVFIQVMNSPTRLKNIESDLKEFSIEPNPNNGEFTFNLHGLHPKDPLEISICNSYGELIYKAVETSPSGNSLIKIDLTSISGGCYIVSLKNGDNIAKKKMVITK